MFETAIRPVDRQINAYNRRTTCRAFASSMLHMMRVRDLKFSQIDELLGTKPGTSKTVFIALIEGNEHVKAFEIVGGLAGAADFEFTIGVKGASHNMPIASGEYDDMHRKIRRLPPDDLFNLATEAAGELGMKLVKDDPFTGEE